MRPPERKKMEFEKVVIGEFVMGTIDNIQYETEHKFIWQGQEKIAPAIRFVFRLDGYKFPHYSRWLNFNTGSKSNLYQKFISKLIENAKPDMVFDLDILKGIPVKTIWNEQNDYQGIESIFPVGGKIAADSSLPDPDEEFPVEDPKELEA